MIVGLQYSHGVENCYIFDIVPSCAVRPRCDNLSVFPKELTNLSFKCISDSRYTLVFENPGIISRIGITCCH
jgi:hypothetical protein